MEDYFNSGNQRQGEMFDHFFFLILAIMLGRKMGVRSSLCFCDVYWSPGFSTPHTQLTRGLGALRRRPGGGGHQ